MNQNTNVNLIPKFPFSGNLYFSQYDVGRVAAINLVEDGSAYTIPSGATVKIQATKPSGLGFSVECTYIGSVVTVVSTETMTNEYGRFPCELRIESGDVLLGTTNFTFNVEKSPHPTNTVDGDSEDIINQITVALNNALSDIEDAKDEAIEEIGQSGGGITEAVKQALLNCFAHVAWIDDQGQTYYDALEDALYPPANLVSISAVYTQSGTVYDNQTLDSLKADLVVTASWDDSSTTTLSADDYSLSGTLETGTSVITVSYNGKTDTFNVTVTHYVTPPLYEWDFTQSLTDTKQGVVATLDTGVTQSASGLTFSAEGKSANLVDIGSYEQTTIELDVTTLNIPTGGSGNKTFLTLYADYSGWRRWLSWYANNGIWRIRVYDGEWVEFAGATDRSVFDGKTLKFQIDPLITYTASIYADDVLVGTATIDQKGVRASTIVKISGISGTVITGCRIYEGLV